MKNRIFVVGLVCGFLFAGSISCQSMALTNQVEFAALELNPAITNPQANYNYTNRVNTTKTNYQVPTKTIPEATNKDLQIDGYISKTQKSPLYKNQSTVELQELVSTIGQKIVMKNGLTKNIKFKYVNNKVANANTNINNTVTVYRGLIEYCEDPDELAYVIGHEIGHATSNHVAKSTAVNVLGAAAGIAAAYGISQATDNKWAQFGVQMATDIATNTASSKVSRVQENNADLLSIDYIVKAGYNPLAAISIINKIGENYNDFWSDHPSTDKRIIKMYNYISQKYPQYIEQGYDSVSYEQALKNYINPNKVCSK